MSLEKQLELFQLMDFTQCIQDYRPRLYLSILSSDIGGFEYQPNKYMFVSAALFYSWEKEGTEYVRLI